MNQYYKLLGLQRNASKEQIKQAYRKMVMKCHPDKHSNSTKKKLDAATAKFKRVSEAYEFLMSSSSDYTDYTNSSSKSTNSSSKSKSKSTNSSKSKSTSWSEPEDDYYYYTRSSSNYHRYTHHSNPYEFYTPGGIIFTADEWYRMSNTMAKGMFGFCCFFLVFFPSLMAYNLVYDPLKKTILEKFKGNNNTDLKTILERFKGNKSTDLNPKMD